MTLDRCPVDVDLKVVDVGLVGAVRLRMREVGLHVGATVRVTHRAPFGGRVIGIGASRIAVDSATAALIEVGPVVGSLR